MCFQRGNEVHHIIPRIEGGSSELSNLLTTCKQCHGKIEVHVTYMERVRMAIARDLDPHPVEVKPEKVILTPTREEVQAEYDSFEVVVPPDKKIMLDTGKFRSDLRIALINGAKVWLKFNSANEVISIIEM
jgi:hypothetical protein